MNSHFAKKRLGQHFLSNEAVICQIVNLINPQPHDHLVEIGPGLGAITLPLLPYVAKIDAIELDSEIIPRLEKKAGRGKLTIHQQDALKFRLDSLSSEEKSLRVIGNLPYNISTPLLFHLLKQKNVVIDMHFMLQREVADRIAANPGCKQYGRLSIMIQYHCRVTVLFTAPPAAFHPMPKVDSAFIRLIPYKREYLAKDASRLDDVVKQAFTKRRKTVYNALKPLITKEELLGLDIDPKQRPEELSVDSFIKISNILFCYSR
jgi:16S rRNA (adenine1518-N6/adenine1519-N6)-dimethyltransferase